jgi:hypothetical protein
MYPALAGLLPSHVPVLVQPKLDRYMFGVGHCRMVLSIFNNLKSLLMSFLSSGPRCWHDTRPAPS